MLERGGSNDRRKPGKFSKLDDWNFLEKKNTQKLSLNLIPSERETNQTGQRRMHPQHDKRIIPVVTLEVYDICDIQI